MQTFGLHDAANFLHMNPESLRQKVKAGNIPGAKVGKSWVFILEDLAQYIGSLYPDIRQAVQVSDFKEVDKCHFTAETKAKSGGHVLLPQMDSEYESLLGL